MVEKTHCGYVAIIGRPNVGKSTLLNKILGEKVTITSRKPQTTRHRILGIKTENNMQAVYIDTPGVHIDPVHKINEVMIRTAIDAISDVDIIVFVIDARKWTKEDEYVLQEIKRSKRPWILVLNKIDRLESPETLLPLLEEFQKKLSSEGFENIPLVPISAKNGKNILELEQLVLRHLPESQFYFAEDQLTDRSEKFMAAELIREKLMRYLGQEVPHELTVEIEHFKVKNQVLHISAIIWAQRDGQKIIIIGEKGEGLKNIGRLARLDMEKIFGQKVFLQLWVKVKRGWMDDDRALASLGYGES